jgi:2-beta-glucuronyltransferase
LNALFISAHDFRSLRRASVHFIAAEMATRCKTRFFSVGLSRLSQHRGDTRTSLASQANRLATYHGVECYLWKTSWHPFNMRNARLGLVEAALFRAYRMMVPAIPRQWLREADIVFIESGISVVFIADIKRLNPRARIIYLASDELDVIDAASTIKRDFKRHFDKIDTVRLPSQHMVPSMPHSRTSILVPHGVDRSIAATVYPDPYGGRPSCVAVGSMLFDASFFKIAAAACPDLDFHIIGAGKAAAELQADNIIVHPEMAFAETLPYVQHAAFGVAAYRDDNSPRYLIDTSLKLRQFGLFSIPAVCPHFALGNAAGRFGYTPGDPSSIAAAIAAALDNQTPILDMSQSWSEVVDRVLKPGDYPDTRLL